MTRPDLASGIELLKWRRTKIIATLGPASSDAATVARLLAAGVEVVRLNMSHGDHAGHARAFQTVRAAAQAIGRPIGILADLCGPKIRVGAFEDGGIDLVDGADVVVTTRAVPGRPGLIPSQYALLHEEIGAGGRILFDDGRLELQVNKVVGTELSCTVVRGGRLKDRKGMNLPDSALSAAALTDKDRVDARFAIELGVDFLALSFVRSVADIADLTALLPAVHPPKVIAKIERPEAVADMDAIIEAADGIMVARGDLGVELPPEQVPVIQRRLLAAARRANKPCIVATQMLESMIEQPQPTRAEVSDVATAVFGGVDAVMLSAETASGAHPVRAVEMMDRIARQAEAHLFAEGRFGRGEQLAIGSPLADSVARATAQLSRDLRLRGIVVISTGGTGATSRVMSAARPAAPVVGVAASPHAVLQMTLLWGVIPYRVEPQELALPEELARRLVRELDLATTGDRVLVVEGFREGGDDDTPRLTVLGV